MSISTAWGQIVSTTPFIVATYWSRWPKSVVKVIMGSGIASPMVFYLREDRASRTRNQRLSHVFQIVLVHGVTKIIGIPHLILYNAGWRKGLKEFDAWIEDLANKPLPGGVAAAAVAAAMGAALVTKAAGATLQYQALSPGARQRLEELADLAQASIDEFQRLAMEDERAYRRVLQTRALTTDDAERRLAWREATEVPVRVAEGCRDLLLRLDALVDRCWPAVVIDLRIGRRLLATGLDSGVEAAEENLRAWGEDPEAQDFRSRIYVLRERNYDRG
jgi:methenyltetrahydrofolate cyclohydrolase